jgi:PAS domain S-box-containing protein
MARPIRVLLVEDNPDDAALVARALERGGYPADLTRVEDRPAMEAALARGPWDLVIADHSLPRFSSSAAIATLRAADEDVGCIIVSGSLGEEAAVQAMRAGADDYVLKDRLGALPGAVERAFRTAETRRERRRAEGRYRRLVESAPDGVVTVDRTGIITSVNPAFETMAGMPAATVVGRHFREFLHPDDAVEMVAGFEGALSVEAPTLARVRVLNGAGLYFHAELTVARLREGDEVVGLFGIFRDITERRAMERELRRSEAHLRTLVESAPDGIYTLAPTGEVTSINPALTRLLALDFPMVGRRFREVVYPEDLPRAADTFARRLAGEVIPPYELRLMRPDGTPVPVEITSSTLSEGGRVTGTLGIVRDITRRKAFELELALREERFRLVTLATQDAVYDWDLVKDAIWWNERAATMFGAAPPEGSGLEWWKAQIHPDDRDRVIAGLDRTATEGRELWTDEYRFRHASGGWRVLVDMGLYVYDSGRTAIRMIGAMSDITERREAEAEQLRLQEVIRAAALDWTATFDAVPMQVLLLDGELRMRRLNRTARETMGRPYAELVDRSIRELEGALWARTVELAAEVRRSGAPVVEQVDDPESGRSWNVLLAPVAAPDGDRLVFIARDVTEVTQLQRTLAHERTMSALGALVAGVAHEVRNPLFAISATLDAFEARFGKEPEFTRYTSNLRPEVQRLSALMRDLLEYGRPAVLQPVLADLTPVVRDAVARSERDGAVRAVWIELVTVDPPPVRHDPGRLGQVVQNLLDNAMVHAPDGTRITVRLGTLQAGGRSWYRLAVEDEGPGFRADDLPHVFEPFYSRRRGGTGLGLSIVERLVGQHGGRVTAENRAEGGARVTILLPLA